MALWSSKILRCSRVLPADEAVQRPVAAQPLHVHALRDEPALRLVLLVVLAREHREAPVLGDVHLLAARDLELGAAESLLRGLHLALVAADRHEHLANVNAGRRAERLAEGTTHTGLETIGARARKHLVDTEHIEGVDPNAQVEGVLTGVFDHALVRRDARGLEGLARHALVLARDHVHAVRVLLHAVLLLAAVKDADLRVRDAAAEARLRVGLRVAHAVALGGTATHRSEGSLE